MDKIFINKIFESIKLNNIKQFSALLEQENFLHYSFGRFPLLSVLYLYNSKKIIKKYEKQLINITEYKKVSEIVEIYKNFKNKSGRVLRLYSDCYVSPLEMLLILNQTAHLNYVYKKYNITNHELLNKLKKIEQIKNNSQINFTSTQIKFEKQPLNVTAKKLILTSFILIFVCSMFAVLTSSFTYNLGKQNNPLIITNATQLKMAFESKDKYFELKNNITLSLSQSYSCSSTINGNGKTITITSSKGAIFNNFSGKIYNTTINFNQNTKTLSKSFSYFATKNNGEINNVNMKLNANLKLTSGGETIYLSAFAGENNKQIKDCKLLANVQIIGTYNTDCFFAGFANNNNHDILNCELSENSTISATTADVCGIVTQNNADGKVENCTNLAEISQSTNASSWSPHVTGINTFNHGEIKNCENKGNLKITVSSQGTAGEVVTEAYCAGITAVNYKKISYCKNTADITITNTFYNVYAGGIVAINYFDELTGEISKTLNCGFKGKIELTDTGSLRSYTGGIVGLSIGEVKDCYAIVELNTSQNIKNGGIIGLTQYGIGYDDFMFGFIYITTYEEWYNDNYFYISNTEITTQKGISAIAPETETLTDVGMNICSSVEQVENSEVYW